MPDLNGFEVSRRIRALPEGRFVPIVFLTALDDRGTHQQAIQSGGDDLLNKPINSTELLMRVRSLLWIARLRREMQEGYELIQRQRNDLLRIQRQKEELMNLIVHDLKNPLTAIMANGHFLSRELVHGPLNPELRECAFDIQNSAEMMFRMVTNLLDVSRSEEGALTLQRERFDLQVLLLEAVGGLKRRFDEANRTCELSVERELPAVSADRDLLRRLVENVLDNCLKYTPQGSRVELSARKTAEGRIELRFADQGPGIPDHFKKEVFAKFARLERNSDVRASYGLGLSFCWHAVEAHGGKIWVEDNVPHGAVFCVELPTEPAKQAPALSTELGSDDSSLPVRSMPRS
jgi:signal transduction histidine kinase